VSTVPAELIQTEGEASFKNISGTSLLYADNTLDEIFKDINSQKNYILIAGRWYSSSSMNGPWQFVAADQLPADFAKIPAGSEKDGVLASVAGTDAAEEAKADAVIPQTANIDRATAKCTVSYDGDPKFSPIDNTSLYVADNSNITVIKAGNKYFAVENGVWFQSKQATGPWEVSTERPSDVEKFRQAARPTIPNMFTCMRARHNTCIRVIPLDIWVAIYTGLPWFGELVGTIGLGMVAFIIHARLPMVLECITIHILDGA